MGKINQGILGGFSGAVGPVVGSSWKGIDYMKSKPTSVANPRTAAQIAQREKFANVVAFAVVLLSSIIKPLRDRFAVRMSGFNAFVQDNIDLFVEEMPSPAADLVIASGKMAKTDISDISAAPADTDVDVDWVLDAGSGYKLATDIAYCVVVNETKEELAFSDATKVRSDLGVTISLPSLKEVGDVLNAYLVFLRDDGTVCSNTAFSTFTVI